MPGLYLCFITPGHYHAFLPGSPGMPTLWEYSITLNTTLWGGTGRSCVQMFWPRASISHQTHQKTKAKWFSPKSLIYKSLQATSTDTEENRDEQSSQWGLRNYTIMMETNACYCLTLVCLWRFFMKLWACRGIKHTVKNDSLAWVPRVMVTVLDKHGWVEHCSVGVLPPMLQMAQKCQVHDSSLGGRATSKARILSQSAWSSSLQLKS